jgi:hypothetical protein
VFTAYIEVTFPRNVVVSHGTNHLCTVSVMEHVVMPCVAASVKEEDDVREGIVMVDDVGKVDHGFAAFILGWM